MSSEHGVFSLSLSLMLLLAVPGRAQTVAATVTAGTSPQAVAVNTATNKIYVANSGSRNITVVDGLTNSTTTVQAGLHPLAVAVNKVTNKIYVANHGDALQWGGDRGSITVIDGTTGSTTTVIDPNAAVPNAVAVNSVTNKIYVANFLSSNITVIDGNTNATTTITDPNAAGLTVYAVAVNETTNTIYVANNDIDRPAANPGNITVLDGATNSTTTVTDPNAISPFAVAVNPVTNTIYVANGGNYPGTNHGSVTIVDGATNSITAVTDANALAPQAVAVNQITNKIYVANINDSTLSENGGVTVIDGVTNAITSVRDPNAIAPSALAVDPTTNRIYVANQGGLEFTGNNPGCVTVIDGATNTTVTVIDPKAIAPSAIAANWTTDKIYVANGASGNVTAIDGGASATSHILSVLLVGTGSGNVTSNPAGINCGTSCSASFATGTAVNLTASAASGSFSELSGACTGTDACSVMMNQDNLVTATFSTTRADFSLQATSASLSARYGGQVTDTITIAPLTGSSFGSSIQLSCAITGPSPKPTCTLLPTSVTPGANPAISMLTITAPAAAATLFPAGAQQFNRSLYALWLPLMLGSMLVGRPKRPQRGTWILVGFLMLLFLQTACGNSNGGSIRRPPTNYTVTVTGSSGAIQHTTQLTVTVQ